MTFLAKALRFERDAMIAQIMAAKPSSWSPKFVVLHNTGAPSLVNWLAYSDAQKQSWGDNLNAYYRRMGWHAGPHLAAPPESWSYQLCDLNADGVHASCFNSVAYGIEMVGDFRAGGDDPTSGPGLAVVESAITMLAALHTRFGWDPADFQYGVRGLHFHCECKRDAHACPGARIDKADIVARVRARMTDIRGGSGAQPSPLPPSALPSEDTPMPATIELPAWPPIGNSFFALAARCFNAWKALGYGNPQALGMLAQGEAECSLNVKAVGDHGTAYGLHQWHGDRCAAIKAGCGIDPRTEPLIERHVQAAHWELHSLERNALMKIEAAATAMDAGIAACVFYERAGAALAAQRRGAMAERFAVLFSSDDGKKLLADNPPQS